MQMMPFVVEFDDAEPFQVQPTSRDLVKLEKDGVDLQAVGNMIGGYTMAYAALQRLDRQGKLPDDVKLPKSLDDFMEAADLVPVVDEDPEGNGSAPEATTGS